MRLGIASFAAALALAGCGGGVFLGIGPDDDPPDVELAAGVAAARAGEPVRLLAAADDDFFVDEVRFYRLRADGSALLLDVDTRSPFETVVAMPASDVPVRFFARAVDSAGQSSDSALVEVAPRP